jgi:hypothetical protein
MADERRKIRKSELALALARGISAGDWAQSNEVSKATAYRWAKDTRVRDAGETYRRQVIDQAVGVLTQKTIAAATKIASIAMDGESDSVQLRACRAIFSDMITTSKYSGLEERVSDMEKLVGLQHGGVSGAAVTTCPPR